MNSNHKNKSPSKQDSRPVMVHSTHSNMETFDQVTREQEAGIRSSNVETMATTQSTTGSSSSRRQQDQQRQLQEANTGIQLDRDVQQSRRIVNDASKPQGDSRSWKGDNPNELPYVE
ncbi:hypothetical protein EMPS_03569 [Entomortierella parvispora]|uniref:Uncharacterized protein n=1 Tax=Entomortierella parvispora TaxID=205924 RepID=A0A9P3H6U8_9FUNG|nr:hypothetical protein EMPS_03569 [Entomortierella parvispora]